MESGPRAFGLLLADREARAFSAAGFVARMPLSMAGLGIVLVVSLASGSYARAGLVVAVGSLTAACAAPLWGRAIDRAGQQRVLLVAALLNVSGVALLVVSVEAMWPLPVTLVGALVAGAGFTSAGACVRARWSARLAGRPELQTALALEAILDEVVFIVGPPLVTVLATQVHPALGVSVAATLGLIGAVLLAAQRSSQPAIHPHHAQRIRPPMGWAVLGPVLAACVALGVVFGGMEVVVVAFAGERGLLPYAGGFLTVWSLGSLVAGAVTGSIAWRAAPTRRFAIAACGLALSLTPLPLATHPAVLGGLLLISGAAIAPTLIASAATVQARVPAARLTEALGWTSTGLAVGLAGGAAAAGRLVDSGGAAAGFSGLIVAGAATAAAAVVVALIAREERRPARSDDASEPSDGSGTVPPR